MLMNVPKQIKASHSEMLEIFKDIHRNPETGFEEQRTSKLVKNKLEDYGVDEIHEKIGGTGVVGIINGKGKGNRAVGIRADMDALPIHETTNLEYASEKPGQMHACGHDGHTTMLLGAAKYLCETRKFDGRAVLIFQPAEEGLGGARQMLKEGLLAKFPIDEIFGMHNKPNLDPNQVEICKGAAMAGAAFFDIEIHGQGSHAAMPQKAKDPLLLASSLVSQLNHIVSRNISPFDTCVLSVTKISCGTAYNVIPETAFLSGTIRFFVDDVFNTVQKRMQSICHAIEVSNDIKVTLKIERVFDVLVNDDSLSEAYMDAALEIVGAKNINRNGTPSTGSEDFADFLKIIPGAYCNLGHAGDAPLHSPNFFLDTEILPIGSAIFSRIIERRLPLEKTN